MSLTGTGTWTYSYDAGDRLTQVVNPSSETSSFSYDNANRQTGQTSGNGSTVTTTFDNANRPTEILHKNSSSVTLADYQYSYDGAGNVSTRTDSDGTVTSFGYDAADQLNSEVRDNSHSTGYSLAYSYDHNANRLTKVVGTGGSAVTTTNTYGTHDQLLTSGSKSYGYDSNGNCTSVTVGTSVTSISYDYENRVTGITYPSSATNSFTYNGNDLRMQKVDSAGTANYVCDGTTPASAVLKDGSAVYTPGLSERRGTTSKFYHGDALGSTRGITNASQAVTDSVLYDGFGMVVSRTGTTPTPFGFVGKGQYQTDNDSGLQLLGHRYYDASVGRFISSDPAKAGNNWYAYCDNNPITRIDPKGQFWFLIGVVLLAIDLLVQSEKPADHVPPGYHLPSNQRPPWLSPIGQMMAAHDDPVSYPPIPMGFSGMDGGGGGGKFYIPRESGTGEPIPLPREGDIPLPDPSAGGYPHTRLGGKYSSADNILYRQSAEFNGPSWPSTPSGNPAPFRQVDWGDHGRPGDHMVPHQHPFTFQDGSWVRGGGLPFYW